MVNRDLIKNIPAKPGIYIFKDKDFKPIYVGKAKRLKNRLGSYFNPSNQLKNEKTLKIINDSEYIDYILTESEDEAFVLEANLIYTYKPKYNILLKDTRVYPYILITDEKYPTIKYVRIKNEQKGTYFGPYPNVRFVKEVIEVLQRVYKVRSCERNMDRKSKPCFLYHLGMCYGPCYKEIDESSYKNAVNDVLNFLKGNVEKVKEYLEKYMEEYSKILNFEKAAQMRDTLLKLDRLFIKLGVEFKHNKNIDVIVYEEPIYVLLKIREGYLISKVSFTLDSDINEFIHQFYIIRKNEIPPQIFTLYDENIDEQIKNYLKNNGLKMFNKLSRRSSIYSLAFKNLEEELKRYTDLGNTLKQAKEILSLKKIPKKIEGIDISHLQGMYTVASLVNFENGKPEKSGYRRYRLDEFKEPNDFESIKTVIKRRYKKHELPDLLFIDGGKGQVNSALKALNELGYDLKDVDLVGIAKEDERVVFPGEMDDLHLPLDNPVLRLLIYIRDETHRFAIGFNRKLRSKRFEKTKLDEVSGIGPVRKKKLITHFGGLNEILEASVEEIAEVINSEKVAKKIKQELGDK
ncbi:excinuclease ABC subunit C [Oceanotoga teriensis]|jgi:excinuclease ABC subunit C|uniref:UvrABC system protein C n=1 Tax=Oceanotoga teriensis TaxID=515440 RepID=A0AA45HHL1_9BACT|nr:excinuclease ABC subunit UvrC [Oceanotoga teriensis]PWJ87411.1 excinuclease ABC subunit C [Oceanotoga teriensis]